MTGPTVSAITYPASRVGHEGATFWLEREGSAKHLIIEGGTPEVLDAFHGTADQDRFVAPADAQNALALRRTLPWLAPRRWGLATTAGTGDRLGLCTPGHARAFAEVGGVKPVFAQQSIREMGRTHRTPRNVLDDATWGAFQAGWTDGVGADADHLKTTDDIDRCAEAGFVFYTLDPGDSVDPAAVNASQAELRTKAEGLDWAALDSNLADAIARYAGTRVDLDDTAVDLDEESVVRAFAKYGPALASARALAEHVATKSIPYELELAVDETDYPTTPVEHIVIMRELGRFGTEFVSFSPRFVGEFEKGIEFKGDLDALRRDFEVHAQLARALGPYKLSLHSGSDKYSTFQPLAEATRGVVHLKTAGTSWVESLRIVARFDPDLFLAVLRLSRESFEANRASYRLSCDLAKVPVSPSPDELDDLVTRNDSRQVLHVGFGPALTEYGDQIKQVLSSHESELEAVIAAHFIRHLAPFAAVAQQ
jgi:tagaturonate epimerase